MISEIRPHNRDAQRHRLPMRPSRRGRSIDKKAVTNTDNGKLNLFDVPESDIMDAEFRDIVDDEDTKALVIKS